MASPYSYTQSPTSTRPSNLPTSLRRQRAVQPPSLLTTSLENARNPTLATPGGVLATPVSSTTLSTPFSSYPVQSPYPQSPGGAMRGTSPSTFRSQNGFSAPYNPQQWEPLSDATPQSATSAQRQQRSTHLAPRPLGPDEPVASPPPPYSPRRNQDQQLSPRNAVQTSPSDIASPNAELTPDGTPISAATTVSPDLLCSTRFRTRDIAPVSSASASPGASSTPSFPPPPPGGPKHKGRPAPKISTSGLLSSLRTKTSSSTITVDTPQQLQRSAVNHFDHAPEPLYPNGYVHPPAARRAASTGAIGLSAASSRSDSHSPSPVTWESTTPLPPPPPGPPPASARSQSLNRFTDSPSSYVAPTLPSRHRNPPGKGTTLETVPPTPADWRDESPEPSRAIRNRSRSNGPSALHIDTGSILCKERPGLSGAASASDVVPASLRRDSSNSGLFRSPAVRNRSAKGIRERRNESRNGKGRELIVSTEDHQGHDFVPLGEDEASDDPIKPKDLVLPATQPFGASNLQRNSRASPASARSMQSLEGAIKSPGPRISSGKAVSFQTSNAAPEASAVRSQHTSASNTPVFSPKVDNSGSPAAIHSISSPRSAGSSHGISLIIPPGPEQRPISHLLHISNSEDAMQVVPLTPSTKVTQRPVSDLIGPENPTAFAARANERHRQFTVREAAASNNAERLDLFVQFISAESRIRREAYAAVFEDEGIDVEALTAGLLTEPPRSREHEQRRESSPGAPSMNEVSGRTSIASSAIDSSEQEESSSVSRTYESPGSATSNSSIPNRPESGWAKDYVPCLSPIASMSIVTGQDEMDSRGRAPSRWWEGSRSGDAHGEGFDVLARSKRESKYMGVSKDAPLSPIVSGTRICGSAGNYQWPGGETSRQYAYGPDEYPPEKAGMGEANNPQALPPTPASTAYTPNAKRLDISRLVTLPPPYPRHHPAVNNSHPELDSIRSVVRSLHENSEADAIRETYRSKTHTRHQRALSWQEHQRSLHQQNVQFSISHGEMSSEQYEAAEAELEEKLLESKKETTQAAFDIFQDSVVSPLHAISSERIAIATETLHGLSTSLFSDAQSPSPNLPQEEGDEKPELLERLTMLKWLFEAREYSHRNIYDLLSERNDLYKAIVLLPYANNPSKEQDAINFFTQDAFDRRKKYDREVADRHRAFLSVIEINVSRGVEVQLDAFWQIAPSLKSLLEKIPTDLEQQGRSGHASGFEIQIPLEEYVENESYYRHPLQYLYSLLTHAEKSSYQFIESQVNLLCLLHEIRNAALAVRMRAEAGERTSSDHGVDDSEAGGGRSNEWAVQRDMEDGKGREEARLTEDLKEKVGVIEGQWEEALGSELREVQERIRGQLLLEGGWEDEDDVVVASPIG